MSDTIDKRLLVLVQEFCNTKAMAKGCPCSWCKLGRGGLDAADEIERLRAENASQAERIRELEGAHSKHGG